MRRLALALILLPAFSPALEAQQQPVGTFRVGSRVRVEACTPAPNGRSLQVRRQIGQVLHADSGALVLQTGVARRDTIALRDVAAGWQSVGRRSRWATGLRGLALGVATGALLGFGLDAAHRNVTGDGSGEALESVLLPLFGGVLGGGVGALVGVASGGDQWRRLLLSRGPPYGCAGHRAPP
jgi:hypothetical protein